MQFKLCKYLAKIVSYFANDLSDNGVRNES